VPKLSRDSPARHMTAGSQILKMCLPEIGSRMGYAGGVVFLLVLSIESIVSGIGKHHMVHSPFWLLSFIIDDARPSHFYVQ
jgi:hypothetical protein